MSEETHTQEDMVDEQPQEEHEESTRIYELGFWVVSSLSLEQASGVFGSVKKTLEDNGSVFISEELPKEKELAYEIRKMIKGSYVRFERGYFAWIKCEMSPEHAQRVHTWMESQEDIIRHVLIITVRENTLVPSRLVNASTEAPEPKKKAPAPGVGALPTETKVEGEEESTPEAEDISEEELDKTIDDLVV